jgi:hypothetical protein
MRVERLILGATLLIAAAACTETPPGNTAASTNAAGTSDVNVQQRVAAMPEGERNAVFIRAIIDAGLECQNVQSASPVAGAAGGASWVARCEGGRAYTITLGAGGNAIVQPGAPAGQ